MLFSSPDYPVFLIAVFFLYALARWGSGTHEAWARVAVMVLLGDVVFMLVAKDPDALWDPIGGMLLRLAVGDEREWPAWLWLQWAIGTAALAGALAIGARGAAWIASEAGQRAIGRGFVTGLAGLAAVVAIAHARGTLDEVTTALIGYGHLVVVACFGIGIGVGLSEAGTTRDRERHRQLGRIIVLFVASSLFYHAWAAAMPGVYRYLLAVLLATIVLDYYLALWIERATEQWRRKALLVVSLCSNLGILVFFKYADFFAQDVLRLDVERLNLILPAGISFHTFQSLSYTIDVYRKELPATRSVVEFATFVLFFPQLVAGPIVRAQDLLPQLADPPRLELDRATRGLFRIVIGLFKKVALADAIALLLVDRVFEAPERYSSVEVLAGVYGYALQIYLDFSAYSDIAIGSAMVLGFTLPENFRTPYRSANLQEFWRRWHISLSTWLRDYLYIALGGSKGTAARTYLNLIVTMLLGGLWHGASWAFVAWGALHGFGLAVTRYFQRAIAPVRVVGACVAIAVAGAVVHAFALTGAGTWVHLVAAWLYLTPLWAVLTAWLGRAAPAAPEPETLPWRTVWSTTTGVALVAPGPRRVIEVLRLAMCLAAIGFLYALAEAPSWTWAWLALAVWALAAAADLIERGPARFAARVIAGARRGVAVVLVFQYVCLAWVFFRATSFDNALAVLDQISLRDTDHANLVPVVSIALLVGGLCHWFPDGSFRWLRDRFVALPPPAQGFVLAAVALVLGELAQTKMVPFIYFQF